MVTEYLFTFPNTHYAVKSEKLLKKHRLPVAVMALPENLGDYCGICLRLDPNVFEEGRAILAAQQIPVEGIFRSELLIDGRTYIPWKP